MCCREQIPWDPTPWGLHQDLLSSAGSRESFTELVSSGNCSQGYGHNQGCANHKGWMSCLLAELGRLRAPSQSPQAAKQHPSSSKHPQRNSHHSRGTQECAHGQRSQLCSWQRLGDSQGFIFTLTQPSDLCSRPGWVFLPTCIIPVPGRSLQLLLPGKHRASLV